MSKDNNKQRVPWWQPGLLLFAKLSGWIAGPVILAVFVGKWLDRKYSTEPWLFLLSVGIAFFASSYGIVRDSLREMKRIEKEALKKKSQLDSQEK
jgi:hypothetical protein